ncbi:MAG: hypothetical protein J1F03_01555 [Oscillospiraceae bacterium]|nr:hypothetical protein [Oscillospiraceae bacterium]
MENKDKNIKKKPRGLIIFNIAAILAVFAGITVFINTAPRPTVSVEEKRELAKCPKFTVESYFSGEFTEKFSEYYNDAVPMRSNWKLIIAQIRENLGFDIEGGAHFVGPLPEIEK